MKWPCLTDDVLWEVVREWFRDKDAVECKWGPMEEWDTHQLTDMSALFCRRPTFQADLSKWDVRQVTNMSYMFCGATSFSSDLSKWNTSRVTTMSHMFCGATSFSSDLSNWNTGRVTNMTRMFEEAFVFDSDLSRWDTCRVLYIWHIFFKASRFCADLSSWNLTGLDQTSDLFYDSRLTRGESGMEMFTYSGIYTKWGLTTLLTPHTNIHPYFKGNRTYSWTVFSNPQMSRARMQSISLYL